MTGSKPDAKAVRLQKYLASCGAGSRRTCEAYIISGRVGVNGVTVTELGRTVLPNDAVTLDGKPVVPAPVRSYALHKPPGYLASNRDPRHDRLARDLIDVPDKESLFHAGRLDLWSSGLIIYTNDGEFALKLTHPRYVVEKEYVVTVRDKFLPKHLEMWVRGVQLNDGFVYNMKDCRLEDPHTVRIVLTEGKNREIRNVLSEFGYTILKLHRVRIADIQLGNLKPGQFREIERDAVRRILDCIERGRT